MANYIAKYTTKAADVPGLPDTRIRTAAAIAALRCSAHHKRMVTTAWQLGAHDSVDDPRLRLWAHMLGYGGHFLTKSRRYSVSFGQLRRARAEHRRLERYGDADAVRDPWAARSMTLWSWSSTTGRMQAGATRPAASAHSSPSPPLTGHAATSPLSDSLSSQP